jgi:hypothetical protein
MKTERSCATAAGVERVRGGLRRIDYLLFLATAVAAAVGASASPYGNQGGSTSLKAMANLAEGAGSRDSAAPGNIILVTNTNDSGPGSLRAALAVANDGDTIDATGVSGTILLTRGELQISHSVTINGPGAGTLAVNGNGTFRVFENFASDVTVSGITITNGFVLSFGGGISSDGGGTLTVTNSVISGNITGNPDLGGSGGGGLYYAGGGTLTVANSVISGNGTYGIGGGMRVEDGVSVTITDSTISDNSVFIVNVLFLGGGGISAGDALLIVMNSTISGNSAGLGGGILTGGDAQLTVMNSTISGNVATSVPGGGGIYCSGPVTVTNSTISGNSAEVGNGGAIHNFGATQIEDTVLNAGASGGTIFNDGGTVTSLGYNLASDDGGGVLIGPGDQINTDPMLGPLQDNGGPTFTHALLPGSPAIDAGDPNFTPPPFFDQRGPGFDRVVNGRIDIGSFEVQGPAPTPTTTPTPTATATATPTATTTPTPTVTPRPTPTPRSAPTARPRPTPVPRP